MFYYLLIIFYNCNTNQNTRVLLFYWDVIKNLWMLNCASFFSYNLFFFKSFLPFLLNPSTCFLSAALDKARHCAGTWGKRSRGNDPRWELKESDLCGSCGLPCSPLFPYQICSLYRAEMACLHWLEREKKRNKEKKKNDSSGRFELRLTVLGQHPPPPPPLPPPAASFKPVRNSPSHTLTEIK